MPLLLRTALLVGPLTRVELADVGLVTRAEVTMDRLYFYPGETARFDFDFVDDAADAYTDPAAVFAALQDPNDAIQVFEYGTDDELTKRETGRYRLAKAFTSADVGTWRFKGYSTGDGAASTADATIEVRASAFSSP